MLQAVHREQARELSVLLDEARANKRELEGRVAAQLRDLAQKDAQIVALVCFVWITKERKLCWCTFH